MKKTLILASLVAAACISPAMAHDEMAMEQKARWYFDRIDANHDGAISPTEHAVFANQMFSDADTNRDGKVTYDELLAAKRLEHEQFIHNKTVVREGRVAPDPLPNRTNANPSDRSINKGAPDQTNSKYLSK